jgi:hypothetical protein
MTTRGSLLAGAIGGALATLAISAAMMLAAYWVYGAVLGVLATVLRR